MSMLHWAPAIFMSWGVDLIFPPSLSLQRAVTLKWGESVRGVRYICKGLINGWGAQHDALTLKKYVSPPGALWTSSLQQSYK